MVPPWVTFGKLPPEMQEPDTYVLVGMAWVGILGLGPRAELGILAFHPGDRFGS